MIRDIASAECERLVADLLAHMSLAEKAGQLGVHHLGDLSNRNASDALMRELKDGRIGTVRGVISLEQADALQEIATERSRLGIPLLFADETGTGFRTVLPTQFAAACSWDVDAIEAGERVVAAEAAMHGINWSLSPEVLFTDLAGQDVARSIGEDAYLASRIAAARVRGLQGGRDEAGPGVLATLDLSGILPTHGEAGRRTAIEALTIAERAIDTGHLGVIAFDKLSGEQRVAMDNAFSFLRGPGGFAGIILSEWERLAANAEGAGAGIGFEDLSVDALISAVQAGRIKKSRLDDAVLRILRAKFALGLFEAALGVSPAAHHRPRENEQERRSAAQNLAARSMVLLRNTPALLPLGPDAGDVLIVGTAAGDRHMAMAGRGGGEAASVIDGLQQLGVPHKYVAGLALRGEGIQREALVEADRMAIAMASEAAKRARTVVVVIGESNRIGQLGEAQQALLEALRRVNQRIVLVTGGSLPIDPMIGEERLDCVLHAGQLGTMSGHAIAEVLAGRTAPSGKLPLALPGTDGAAGLPFGHGLSYAEFDLSALAIGAAARTLNVSATLTNVGTFAGTETVQLYLAHADAGADAGPPRLADFQKIALQQGESRTVHFTIDAGIAGRHLPDGRFVVEPGELTLAVGLSSKAVLAARAEISPELARAMAGLSPTVTPFRRRA